MADPLPCLQSHCCYLGAVSGHHGTLSNCQHAGALFQTQQHHCSHVPPRLAHKPNGTDLVSLVRSMIILMNAESACQISRMTGILMSKSNYSGFHINQVLKKATAVLFCSRNINHLSWILQICLYEPPSGKLYEFPLSLAGAYF